MSDGDALFRAVCEQPWEDTPRLVYADWLDENGDPRRAEFIRLQCALDAADPFAPDRWPRLRREWNLLRRSGEQWVSDDGLSALVAGESLWHYPPHIRFRRGFLDRFWVNSPEEFERKAPALFARAPVTGVRLGSPYTVEPAEGQWFQNTFTNIWNANCARRLSGFPHQPLLQPGGTAFPEPEEFRRLVEGESFARLRSFALGSIYSDRRHIEILATAPAAAGLQELDLSGNALIEDDGWAILANAPRLAGLRALALDGSRLGVSEVAALANSPHLTGLQRLSLAGHDRAPLGAEAVRALCGGRGLNQLRELNLGGQSAGADGFRALAGWPGLARLTRLDLSYSYSEQDEPGWMSAAWDALARSPHWGGLRELHLDGGSVDALAALLAGPNVATLRVLGFDHAFREGEDGDSGLAQDEAAALLAGCPHLSGELVLQLPAEGLTPDGLRRLRDRFGERLLAIPDVYGANRQPGDWSSGRPSRCAFYTEEPDPGRPPDHAG